MNPLLLPFRQNPKRSSVLHHAILSVCVLALFAPQAAARESQQSGPRTYDVYLIAGQSNADGRGFTSDLTGAFAPFALPRTDVRLYYVNPANSDPIAPTHNTGWTVLGPGYSVGPGFPGSLPSDRFGFEVSLGHALANHDPSRSIAFIKVSRGGTNLANDWDPAGGANYMWRTLTNTVTNALAALTANGDQAVVRGMFWHQGESDGGNPTYEADLIELIASVRSLVGNPALPFAIGELERDDVTPTVTGRNNQLAAMARIAAADPNALLVSSAGLLTYDGTHFTSAAYITLGQRYADAYLFHVRENTLPTVSAGADQQVTLGQAVPWTPALLSPVVWLDAADTGTVSSSVGDGFKWADKSGLGNHALQSNAAVFPTTGTATLGGLPTVSFRILDSTNKQFLTIAHNATLNLDATGGANIFSVFRHLGFLANGSTGVNALLSKGPMLGADSSYGIRLGSNNAIGFKAGTDVLISSSDTQTANQAFLFSGTRNDSTRASSIHLNGALANSSTKATAILSNNTSPLQIGRDSATTRHANVDFGEILIAGGGLSVADRQRAEGYLAHKWSLTASLPADHPHKVTAPGSRVAVATLAGSVADADGDALLSTWTLVTGPAPVAFSQPLSPQTTATFSETGVYLLRLTTTDGVGTVFDDVTVTVGNPPPSDPFAAWAGLAEGSDRAAAFGADANGDGVPDGLAWLLGAGTPEVRAPALLPVLSAEDSVREFVFRMRGQSERGTAVVKLQYSSNLAGWTDVAIPGTSGVAGGITFELTPAGDRVAVRATLPADVSGDPSRLFVRLSATLD